MYFIYALGGIESIRKGDFDSMQAADSLDKLDLVSHERIIIPRFVGIYQDWKVKADTREERENKEEIEGRIKELEFLVERLAKLALEKRGERERFNAKLIHVGYEPEIYDEKLTRQLLGQGSKRLGVSAYRDLPDFAHKDTVLAEMFIEHLAELRMNTDFAETDDEEKVSQVAKIAGESYETLQEQLQKFGLTREEFAFLHALNMLRNPPQKRRIDTGSLFFDYVSHMLAREE
jgi:hypothetical protein